MSDRLSSIVTRTGDDGSTGLGDGSRVAKDSVRIQALGDVDELNSVIGVLLAETPPPPIAEWLAEVQHDLFDLGSELAVPGYQAIGDGHVQALEALVSFMNEELGPLKEFILPGGLRTAALAHQARSVCRRAERAVVALAREENVSPALRRYLNRLSDFLFVLARYLNREGGVPDVLWRARRR
ncbi:ATP:cob(I)alamin adenosyltransferase [Chromobacterium violaceum]|uniref:cob(I)yrinic acid a,c-diamide adenosyltransferase n=1 Tax=Chromobacterium violaceum TaxID=536 RepID=UPI0009D934AF|nr:cob(I)yrinic acid a,c-diamide adenosyltransferase [Chromobacterium violaceum]OQS48137.1 ATP:cob(I)alamin adenosyltransferase [Chromobacterium violaceum]OQS50932.1 ATP:cob(I)alamin adenosyltransferase [Chromobacterium violaceum]